MTPVLVLATLLFVANLLLALGMGGLTPSFRWEPRRGWILLGVALVVWVGVLPIERHLWDGHEADYFDVWRGKIPIEPWGYQFYPALGGVYRGVGRLVGGSGAALLALSLVVGALTLVTARRFLVTLSGDPTLADVASVLLVLDGVLAGWAASAYNVMLPLLFSLLALLTLEKGIHLGRTRLFVQAGLWLALAFALRRDALMVVPLMFAQVLTSPRRIPLFSLGMATLPALAFILVHTFAQVQAQAPGAGPQLDLNYTQHLMALQWQRLWLWTPWDHPALLLGGVLGGVAGWWRGKRRFVGLSLFAITSCHLLLSGFDDYGTRHTLLTHVMMAGLVATGLVATGREFRWGRVLAPALGMGVGGVLALSLQDVYQRYYAEPADFLAGESRFQTLPDVSTSQLPSDCIFITESWFFRQQATASHFELLDPTSLQSLWERSNACLILVEDLESWQFSSRGIWERRLKIEAIFEPTPIGRHVDPALENYAVLMRIESLP